MTIICCDALYLLKNLPKNYCNLLLTDIPYNEVNRKSNGLRNLDKKEADILNLNLEELASEFVRVTSGSIYVFCGIEQISFLKKYFRQRNLTTRLCIWEKTNPSPLNGQYNWLSGIECCVYAKKRKATFNTHCKNSVWRYSISRKKKKNHPTPKPLKLFEHLINISSNQGDMILDPFVGSGTTAIAAQNLGRKFLCSDNKLEFCIITKKQLIAGKPNS